MEITIQAGQIIRIPDKGLYHVTRFYFGNPVLRSLNDGTILEENVALANWYLNRRIWEIK
jgi:hypothetical protein